MASPQLHFVLIPLFCPGHLIPMIDMAKILATRGVLVTIVTTARNAMRFNTTINHAIEYGLSIRTLQLPFPATEFGLPEGCENMDNLPSRKLVKNFQAAACMLQKPIEQYFAETKPSPSCMISDRYLPWTAEIARKLQIPRLIFDGTNCFALLCSHNIYTTKVHETVTESEPFVVPNMPDHIEFTRTQLPGDFNPNSTDLDVVRKEVSLAAEEAYGTMVNSFEELEPKYLEGYKKVKGDRVWCIGPLSLCNKEDSDKAQRGGNNSIDENHCLKWLNSWAPNSVVYACLGSLSRLTPSQLIEFGLGLEAANQPFIWAIRGGDRTEELEKLILEDGLEERTKGRGLLIRGWVTQVLILSHPAAGAFLTHCGWNSTIEGLCASLPMIACPLFADQFYNEKLIVQVLKIAVGVVGAKVAIHWGEEEKFGVFVKSEEVRKAINKVMDKGKDGEERRERARKLGEMAKRAVEGGGSSYLNISLLIEDIMQHAKRQSV